MAEFTSVGPMYGKAFLNTIIAAYKTAPLAALIATAKLRLSKDPAFAPAFDATVAGLAANEADFTGYTAGGYATTVSDPLNVNADTQGALKNQLIEASGSTVPNNCYGYWIDDGTNVIIMEAFPPGSPAQFAQAGDFLDLTVILPQTALQPAQ